MENVQIEQVVMQQTLAVVQNKKTMEKKLLTIKRVAFEYLP